MYIVVIKNKVKEGCREEYASVSRKFSADMRHVEGCKDALVLISRDEDDVVVNFEMWESEKAHDAYDGHVFMKYKSELKPLFLGNETFLFDL